MKMDSRSARKLALLLVVGSMVLGIAGSASAQLEIVEIMYDTLATGDSIYEWIEVRNTGAVDFDLNGAWMDDFDPNTAAIPPTGNPTVGPNASTTIVPAGGVAVIYDAFLGTGSPANFNDQLFRDSWGLDPSVALIAGDFFPNLNNTSPSSGYIDNIGIWANQAAYELDVDRMGTPATTDDRVVSVANALVHQSYQTTSPWPGTAQGQSIQWRGVGSIADGANWYASVSGQNGATTNAAINLPGAQLNNTSDVGNPGLVPVGTATGLQITEVMYNPRSAEPGWEWVEVINKTGAAIDFTSTPYVFDDVSGANLTAANITTGSIGVDGIAVLFDTSTGLTVQNMVDAWGSHVNFIPVANFSALNNTAPTMTDPGGDTIGIWDSLADYNLDSTGTRVFTNSVEFLDYDISSTTFPNAWPDDDGNGSIWLTNLSSDPTVGSNWSLALTSDGLSYSPNAVFGTQNIHPGGDVASPGSFIVVPPPAGVDGDYNDDGTVDAADYAIFRKFEGTTTTLPNDPTGGTIGIAQYNTWVENFGETAPGSGGAVPEPTSAVLLAIGLAALCGYRRAA